VTVLNSWRIYREYSFFISWAKRFAKNVRQFSIPLSHFFFFCRSTIMYFVCFLIPLERIVTDFICDSTEVANYKNCSWNVPKLHRGMNVSVDRYYEKVVVKWVTCSGRQMEPLVPVLSNWVNGKSSRGTFKCPLGPTADETVLDKRFSCKKDSIKSYSPPWSYNRHTSTSHRSLYIPAARDTIIVYL
jgi:hypothetical protein